jgi:hypothetical protein
MKKLRGVLMCMQFLVFFGTLCGYTEVYKTEKRLEIVYGPRVGVTYIVADPEKFDESVQGVFPDGDREYFPIITQFGLNVEQRIRLGNTQSHFAFQEVLLLGGLDQNIVIPSLSLLIGFRSHVGLEFGLGPNVSMTRSSDEPGIGLSVVYAAGWTFSFEDVFVPVNIAVVPTPSDKSPRITLLTGFNFKKN